MEPVDPAEVAEAERQLEALDFLAYVERLSEAGSHIAREILEQWHPGREAGRMLSKAIERASRSPATAPGVDEGTHDA